MTDRPTSFLLEATGGRASINACEFYSCDVCGACIVEKDRSDQNRTAHAYWHAGYTNPYRDDENSGDYFPGGYR